MTYALETTACALAFGLLVAVAVVPVKRDEMHSLNLPRPTVVVPLSPLEITRVEKLDARQYQSPVVVPLNDEQRMIKLEGELRSALRSLQNIRADLKAEEAKHERRGSRR